MSRLAVSMALPAFLSRVSCAPCTLPWGGLPVDVVVHPLVDLVRVLAQVGGQLADGGGVRVAKKALVAPLTKAHRGQSNRDRAFDHKKARSAGRTIANSYQNYSDQRLPLMGWLIAPRLTKEFSSDAEFPDQHLLILNFNQWCCTLDLRSPSDMQTEHFRVISLLYNQCEYDK